MVFFRQTGGRYGYRFVGVFRTDAARSRKELRHVYARVSDRIERQQGIRARRRGRRRGAMDETGRPRRLRGRTRRGRVPSGARGGTQDGAAFRGG